MDALRRCVELLGAVRGLLGAVRGLLGAVRHGFKVPGNPAHCPEARDLVHCCTTTVCLSMEGHTINRLVRAVVPS